jgi:hypothetical protein
MKITHSKIKRFKRLYSTINLINCAFKYSNTCFGGPSRCVAWYESLCFFFFFLVQTPALAELAGSELRVRRHWDHNQTGSLQ